MRERRAGGGCGIERLGMRASVRDRWGEEGERKEKGKGEKGKRRERRKKEKRGKRKKGEEVEGPIREKQKTEEGGCKKAGVGKQNCQGKLGQTLGFEVRWALGRLGYSLAILKIFLFRKN